MIFKPSSTMGWDLKACAACLSTDNVKLIVIRGELKKNYNSVAGLQALGCDVLPNYICTYCLAETVRFHKFRNKCQRSYFILQELNTHGNIQKQCLKLIDRDALGISSTLGLSQPLSLATGSSYYEIPLTPIKEETEPKNGSLTLEGHSLNVFDDTQDANDCLVNPIPNKKVTIKAEPAEKKIASPQKPKQIKKRRRKNNKPLKRNYFRIITRSIPHKKDISKYLSCEVLTPKEQYENVLERSKTEKYLNAKHRCEHCFKVFQSESTLINHLKLHDPAVSGEIQCDICKSYFQTLHLLRRHIYGSHANKYSCNKCKFVTVNRCLAVKHYGHHENVLYDCPHCGVKFARQTSCLTHIRKRHPSAFLCQICGNNFLTLKGLEQHQKRIHSDEERRKVRDMVLDIEGPLYCKDCNIQFISKVAHDRHLYHSLKHALPNKQKLPRKLRFYNENKKFNCDVCGEPQFNNRQVDLHYKEHHPEYKRYMCDVCGHATKTLGSLEIHYRTHANEKPYQCPYCKKQFKFDNNCKRHIASLHKKVRYKCDLCSSTFSWKGSIKLHIQTVHMKIPYPPWQKSNRKRRANKAAFEFDREILE